MDQHLTQFLSTLAAEKRYSENTISAYKNDLGQFWDYMRANQGSALEPALINADMVEAYVVNLQQGDHVYAPSTVARKIAAVKSFFHSLVQQGIVTNDPAARLNSPKVKKHIPKVLS